MIFIAAKYENEANVIKINLGITQFQKDNSRKRCGHTNDEFTFSSHFNAIQVFPPSHPKDGEHDNNSCGLRSTILPVLIAQYDSICSEPTKAL